MEGDIRTVTTCCIRCMMAAVRDRQGMPFASGKYLLLSKTEARIALLCPLTRGDVPMLNLPRSVARHQDVPCLALSYSRPEPQRRGWERLHARVSF